MKFNIIDGDDDYLEKVPEFVELYNENYYTIPVLCEKLNITRNQYKRLRKQCCEDGLITLRKRRNKKKRTYKTHPKHYSRIRKGGKIYFHIYKNNRHYACCKTREHAEEIVRRLEECNWDKSKVKSIKKQVVGE